MPPPEIRPDPHRRRGHEREPRVSGARTKSFLNRETDEPGIDDGVDSLDDAGYAARDYTIVVQNYVQLIPSASRFRYGETWDRQVIGGCGFQ